MGDTGLFIGGWRIDFTYDYIVQLFWRYLFFRLLDLDMQRDYEKGLLCKRHLVGENGKMF